MKISPRYAQTVGILKASLPEGPDTPPPVPFTIEELFPKHQMKLADITNIVEQALMKDLIREARKDPKKARELFMDVYSDFLELLKQEPSTSAWSTCKPA